MTSFRTSIKLEPSPHTISHGHLILTVGSCFSDSIGNKLLENKFNVIVNPMGTIFHPMGIAKTIWNAWEGRIDPTHFIQYQDRWYHFDFHSCFSAPAKAELQNRLEKTQANFKEAILQADWIIITFGTAWGYVWKKSNELVVNCHQVAGNEFEKYLYDGEEMEEKTGYVFDRIREQNPSLKWMLTVSPVRHIRDGLEGNAVSKSVLRILCNQLRTGEYFPAFEIMMDDLRDYRFYARDMIHPSEEAIDYIWDRFSEKYFTEGTTEILYRWSQVRKSLLHKPFNPNGKPYENFLLQVREELLSLQNKIDVKKELKRIEESLLHLK